MRTFIELCFSVFFLFGVNTTEAGSDIKFKLLSLQCGCTTFLTVLLPPPPCKLNMAAAAAVNRPPSAQPGPNGGNLHSHPNSGVPNPGQQDPGLLSHPQHHGSARPVFYVPAPPPPPFLHYQWPMPFSYNPFVGFPGMGESCGFLFSFLNIRFFKSGCRDPSDSFFLFCYHGKKQVESKNDFATGHSLFLRLSQGNAEICDV